VFLAGAVPEVMLHLRRAGLLDINVVTATGEKLGASLDWWESSSRRKELRSTLQQLDGIDPDDVIMSPDRAKSGGLTPTICFPVGNIAPEGAVIKSTAIDPSVVGEDEVFRMRGSAKVFVSERDAIRAIKDHKIREGDVMVLICGGPMGSGMQETYQVTSALKHLPFGKHVAVVTDARFSGVSTGACIGHVSPEALAGGPISKLQDGDVIEIVVDRVDLKATIDFVGENGESFDAAEGERRLIMRSPRVDLAADPDLPEDTRLWAAMVQKSGGVWAGCVYDVDAIVGALNEKQ
jgi:dihydroxyacid dehydratase/phosphogluconate dehydratase